MLPPIFEKPVAEIHSQTNSRHIVVSASKLGAKQNNAIYV
jgi:hypothetical protein